MTRLELGDVTVDVVQKDIKNIHLSVYPPMGRVRISAPLRMNPDTIRLFAISKLGWIREQRRKLQSQERETPREYLERESYYVWGRRYLLKVTEHEGPPKIELEHSKMRLWVRSGTSDEKKEAALESWYRERLKASLPAVIAKWEPRLNVKVERFFRAADENEVGELQLRRGQHPAQHGAGEKAAPLPRVHRRP